MMQLQLWSREELKDKHLNVEKLIKNLKVINQNNQQDGKHIRKLEKQINSLLLEEEIYQKQRFSADWLKKEDKNTKFFYAKASSRKWKEKIWGIINE